MMSKKVFIFNYYLSHAKLSDDFFIPDETTFESSEDALNKNANKYQISSNSLDGESDTDSSGDESEKSETIGFYFHKELFQFDFDNPGIID